MILYFTGTGNSLAVAQQLSVATGENLMPLSAAANRDLGAERCVGLVYPCYDYNTPPAVRNLVERLRLNSEAYVFVVVTCGAQTGNSIYTVRQILKKQGVEVAYSHKIRMPDNSAPIFGRNPNDQLWKLEKYATRLDTIAADIKVRRHGHHFAAPGLAGWLAGLPAVERKLLGGFCPTVDESRCVGCGTCAAVCPVGNITMEGKAHMGPNCTACLGCLHACPKQAVAVGKKTITREQQYRHPKMSLPDLEQR